VLETEGVREVAVRHDNKTRNPGAREFFDCGAYQSIGIQEIQRADAELCHSGGLVMASSALQGTGLLYHAHINSG
jgi:hypothetical protein